MPAAREWTTAEDRELKKLHGQGLTLYKIARTMGRGQATIHRHAEQLGLSWVRTAQTAAAAQAHKDDARVRRAALALKLLDDAEKLRDRLWTSCEIYNFGGRENSYNHKTVDEPPYRDKRDIVASVQTLIATSLRLDEYDSGDSDAIKSLLGTLFGNLQAQHGTGDDA